MPRERTRSRSSAVPNSVSAEESSSEDVLAARARTLATASEALLICRITRSATSCCSRCCSSRRASTRRWRDCCNARVSRSRSAARCASSYVSRTVDSATPAGPANSSRSLRSTADCSARFIATSISPSTSPPCRTPIVSESVRGLIGDGHTCDHFSPPGNQTRTSARSLCAVRPAASASRGHHLTHRQRVRHPGKQLPHQPVAVRTLAEAEPIGQHRDRTTGQRQQARDQNSGRHHHPQRPPSRGRYQVSPAQRQQRIPDNSNCKSATDDGPRALDIRSHRAPTHSPAADGTAHTPGQGTLPTICVPLPGADSTTSEPPSTATRSANLATPPTESRAPDWLNPTPSSLIAKRNSASPLWMSIRTLVARACLAMFCKASTQQKYTPAATCESSAGGTST